MKKDFDNEFDFLDELENVQHTKDKKVKTGKKKETVRRTERADAEKGKAKAVRAEKKRAEKAEKAHKAAEVKAEKAKTAKAHKASGSGRAAKAEKIFGISGGKTAKKKQHKKENWLCNFWESLCESAAEMSAGDRIVASTGIIVLVMAIITGSVYVSAKSVDNQVAAFAELGEDLGAVSVLGESGLIAVTDAQVAAMNAEIIEETEETEETEESEEGQEENEILLNLTSVQRDLKIKFINRAGGKLISGIALKASVKGPDGKTATYEDDDKDGIIYKTGLAPGSYEVSIVETDGMEGYKYSSSPVTIKVKDKIEYKKIDVADEIKTEAEVNVAKEDTAVQEAETAPALKDTVEWVESTKTPIGTDGSSESGEYEEVDKKDIPDPSSTASARNRLRTLSEIGFDESQGGENLPGGGDDSGSAGGGESSGQTEGGDASGKTEGSGGSGQTEGGENAGKEEGSGSSGKTGGGNDSGKEEGGSSGKTEGGSGSDSGNGGGNAEKPAEKPTEKPVATVTGVSISGATDIAPGGSVTLSATVQGENLSDGDKGVAWSTSDKNIATVDGAGKVTGVSAGTVTITATSSKNSSIKATCQINVKKAAVTVTLSQSELALKVGGSATLTATVSGGGVKWSGDNDKIIKVENGKVTALAEGTATVTATSTEDGNISATCKVTVAKADVLTVKLDAESTKLYTGNTKELSATVTNQNGEVTYTFTSDKADIAKVAGTAGKGTITGVAAGEALITVTAKDASGATATATCKVTVTLNPKDDAATKLKDKDGNQLYVKNSKGEFVEAVHADYYKENKFYKKLENVQYKYTGWQTIDGKTYFYNKDGNPVTGEQIIQGAKYVFGSDGALVTNSSTGIMGIDVSKWNGTINWTAVKNSGVNYVIIRCGYRGSSTGALIQDPKFKANIQGAAAAGIKVGVYFFTQAVNEVEAVEEASMVLDLVRGYKLSYPVFIDVESSGGRADGLDRNTRTTVVNAFCRTIQNGGYKAGVYANKTWFESKMNASALSGYKIWLAQYTAAPTYKATRYDMWQYTSKGKVNGINGNVDMNLSYLGY